MKFNHLWYFNAFLHLFAIICTAFVTSVVQFFALVLHVAQELYTLNNVEQSWTNMNNHKCECCLSNLTRPATVSSVVGFIFLYNSTHHQNPENVKIRLKIGRIMWKAPIKLWEFAICKSRIQQITKQIYLSYLIDISNNMI